MPARRLLVPLLVATLIAAGLVTAGAAAAADFHVNFGPAGAATPAGYTADSGAAFSTARGFGWEDDATGAPLSLVGNGRERNAVADERLDTLMQLQAKANSGVTTPGRWELVVPNGSYALTVAVGDPGYLDSRHVLTAEGTQVVDFTPTSATRSRVVTTPVTVTDGRLTLRPTNGTNTKIDYVDLVAQGSAGLAVTSREDVLGLGHRMVFSTVRNQVRPGHALTLRDTTAAPVTVTGLAFGGPRGADFHLCTGQAATFTIAAGATAGVCVQFRPLVDATVAGTQVAQATLTITTGAGDGPYTVSLGGLNSRNYEGTNEPDLQQVFDALGYGVDAGAIDKPGTNSLGPASRPVGDEVLAPYFTRRDATKPVTLLPIGRYSGKGGSPQFGWHPKGSATGSYLFALPAGTANDGYGENQLLLPATTTGQTTFTPAGAFGIRESAGSSTDDALNFPPAHWHEFRVYPARNAAGATIPGAWLLGEDGGPVVNSSAKNWDTQDYVFLLLNATPDPASMQPVAGEVRRTLASFPGTAGGLVGTGFTRAEGAVDPAKIAFSGGRLRVTTSSDTNTSHTNALQLGANVGTGTRVQARLVGPFTAIDAGSEQQGISFGPSAASYLKAEIEYNATTKARMLSIWRQVDGTGTIVRTIPLPGGDAATVDLRIDVTPVGSNNANPTANVLYAVNGSTTFTMLNTSPVPIPAAWITANTPAGIMTSHQGPGGAPFVASYASFTVTRTY